MTIEDDNIKIRKTLHEIEYASKKAHDTDDPNILQKIRFQIRALAWKLEELIKEKRAKEKVRLTTRMRAAWAQKRAAIAEKLASSNEKQSHKA